MSGDVVNLNKFRKARARKEKEKFAQEQRIRFGRSKAQLKSDALERDRNRRHLDQTFHARPSRDQGEPDQ